MSISSRRNVAEGFTHFRGRNPAAGIGWRGCSAYTRVNMSNLALVRGLYEAFAKGDVPSVLGAMDPGIEWREAEGIPYADGNPYIGPEAVLRGIFARLASEWDGLTVSPGEFLEADHSIVAMGTYAGVYRATGKSLRAQFAHVWWIRNGKIVRFQQYTDTAQFCAVMARSHDATT